MFLLFLLKGADRGVGVLDVPQMEDGEREPDKTEEILQRLSPDLQDDNEDLSREVQPYLGKLEQDGSLACPASIEAPPEDVDGLILYQTEEERSMDSSLDAEAFIQNETGEFLEMKESCESSGGGFGADQVNEISEGRLDCVSLGDAAEEPMEDKPGLMAMAGSELAEPRERTVSIDPDLNRSETSSFSLDRENLLDQNEIKANLTLNDVDAKSSDLKFSIDEEKKPLRFVIPKTEAAEDVCPDSSDIKHSRFLPFPMKSEDTKAEQLEFPLRSPLLDVKPEDLQFVAFSDGGNIKPEVKPADLRFAVYPDGARFKAEIKPEALRLAGFPETSVVKPESKPDALEFAAFPNSSGIKAEVKPEVLEFTTSSEVKMEMKRETLEADSTVLTPKLEQGEAAAESPLKGQVKEERPSSPGTNATPSISPFTFQSD